jgi:hypothetical protein
MAQIKRNFDTLSGAAFMKMKRQDIDALSSRDELVRLALRGQAIVAAVSAFMSATMKNLTKFKTFKSLLSLTNYPELTRQDMAKISGYELVRLALKSIAILIRSQIKPGCR